MSFFKKQVKDVLGLTIKYFQKKYFIEGASQCIQENLNEAMHNFKIAKDLGHPNAEEVLQEIQSMRERTKLNKNLIS